MSVIKALLALHHKIIPPHIYASNLNDHIDWENIPFKVPQSAVDWKQSSSPRHVAVSSFGMSGTNVHLIMEEGKQAEETIGKERTPFLFTLSAKTEDSLRELVGRYKHYLSSGTPSLAEICFTAATGRDHYKHRFCAVVTTIHELASCLDEFLQKNNTKLGAPFGAVIADEAFEKTATTLLDSIPGISKCYLPDASKSLNSCCGSFIRSLVDNDVESIYINELSDSFLRNPYLLLKDIGRAYIEGGEINWDAYYEGSGYMPISLPPYAFRNKPFWPEGLEL